MRLEFQKNIASSPFTLPIVSVVSILLWIILPTAHVAQVAGQQYGLWSLVSADFAVSSTGKFLALLVSALGVYLVAELTNTNILLRISSRMLSSTLALLLGTTLCVHVLGPGLVLMVFTVLSFFALFTTYQAPYPVPTFLSYMMLSIGSLVFPKLLYFVPIYWICQAYLRSFTLRTLMASIFGVLMPYWIFFGLAALEDGGITFFLQTCHEIVDIHMPVYAGLQRTDIFIFGFLVLFFIFGTIDFYINAYLDKTRVRIVYNVIITHTVVTILFMALQPQYFHTLLPLLLVDSSLVGGHYIALTYNKFSHLYFVLVLVGLVVLLTMQS